MAPTIRLRTDPLNCIPARLPTYRRYADHGPTKLSVVHTAYRTRITKASDYPSLVAQGVTNVWVKFLNISLIRVGLLSATWGPLNPPHNPQPSSLEHSKRSFSHAPRRSYPKVRPRSSLSTETMAYQKHDTSAALKSNVPLPSFVHTRMSSPQAPSWSMDSITLLGYIDKTPMPHTTPVSYSKNMLQIEDSARRNSSVTSM